MSSAPSPSTEVLTDPVARYLDATGAGLHLFEAARANKLPATIHHLHLASLICNGNVWHRASVAREIEYACKVLQLKSVAYVPHTLQKGQVIDKYEFLEKRRRFSSEALWRERSSMHRLKHVTLNPEFPKFYLKAQFKRVFLAYMIAAKSIILKLDRVFPRKPRRASYTMNADYWIIHRDHARRYFQTIQWEPEEGSPLWCWLWGSSEQEKGKPRPEQQDKADFQQLCVEHWEVSPTTRIRGEQGIVALIGNAYLRSDTRTTGYTAETLARWAGEVAPPEVKARSGRPEKTPAEP